MGLLDYLPEDETKRSAALQGILATGLGMMANSYNPGGRFAPALAQGGMAGMQTYGSALENAQQQQVRQMQLAQLKRQQEDEDKTRAFFSDPSRFLVSPASQALANGQGPTNANAAAMGSLSPQLDAKGMYQAMLKSGSPALGKMAIEGLAKQESPKLKEIKNFSVGGKLTPVMVFENGSVKTMSGMDVPPEIVMQNLGNRVVAVDKNSLKGGENLALGVSPDTVYSGNITMRGQNMTDARAREANTKPSFHDGSWVFPPNAANPQGGAIKVPGFEKGGNPSEGERKAATLLQRMEGSLAQLNDVVSSNPSAAKPEAFGSLMGAMPWVGGTLGNFSTTSDRQRVESAQLDILDAALTLGTGAAYTREQLEGYRKSYFPQMGDSAETIQDKQDRLNNVIQAAKIAAGRAQQDKGNVPQAKPRKFNPATGRIE